MNADQGSTIDDFAQGWGATTACCAGSGLTYEREESHALFFESLWSFPTLKGRPIKKPTDSKTGNMKTDRRQKISNLARNTHLPGRKHMLVLKRHENQNRTFNQTLLKSYRWSTLERLHKGRLPPGINFLCLHTQLGPRPRSRATGIWCPVSGVRVAAPEPEVSGT